MSKRTAQLDPIADAAPKKRRRVPVFWLSFLLVNLIFVIWLVVGNSSGSHDCDHSAYRNACNSGREAGQAIGSMLVIILWVAVIGVMLLGRIAVSIGRRHK